MVQKINPHPSLGCNRSPPYYVFSKDAIFGSVPSISSEVLEQTDIYLAVLLPSPKTKYKLCKTNSITGNKVYVSQCFRFPSSALRVIFWPN